jgi:hypothetical protein
MLNICVCFQSFLDVSFVLLDVLSAVCAIMMWHAARRSGVWHAARRSGVTFGHQVIRRSFVVFSRSSLSHGGTMPSLVGLRVGTLAKGKHLGLFLSLSLSLLSLRWWRESSRPAIWHEWGGSSHSVLALRQRVQWSQRRMQRLRSIGGNSSINNTTFACNVNGGQLGAMSVCACVCHVCWQQQKQLWWGRQPVRHDSIQTVLAIR